MEIQELKLAYFSPTGTTKRICNAIARGIDYNAAEFLDITQPSAREKSLQAGENVLLVVAVPVYMGRVPALLAPWLNGIRASNTPTVCVVVYGNRAYDDALLELKTVLMKRGCTPVAGAAFIGEHSFSGDELPTAKNRPDAHDINQAEIFGCMVKEKLASSGKTVPEINVPGNYPFGGITELWSVDFISVSDNCSHCGVCAEVCPMGAIDPENSGLIDTEKCITCCACLKKCPQKARTMKPGLVKDAAIRVNKMYQERKEPEFFF